MILVFGSGGPRRPSGCGVEMEATHISTQVLSGAVHVIMRRMVPGEPAIELRMELNPAQMRTLGADHFEKASRAEAKAEASGGLHLDLKRANT